MSEPLQIRGLVTERRIIIDKHEGNQFTVSCGDKYADRLTFDEALGCVASLICPGARPMFLGTAQEDFNFCRKDIPLWRSAMDGDKD